MTVQEYLESKFGIRDATSIYSSFYHENEALIETKFPNIKMIITIQFLSRLFVLETLGFSYSKKGELYYFPQNVMNYSLGLP